MLHYQNNLLLFCSVVTLWLTSCSRRERNWFIVLDDESTQLSIRGRSAYSERDYPIYMVKESIIRDHLLELTEGHFQVVIPKYLSTLREAICLCHRLKYMVPPGKHVPKVRNHPVE